MISEYGIYNNHELDNTLLVLFSNLNIDCIKENKDVDVLYHGQKMIGYRLKNFIRYAKIKYSGIIYLPANPLIDVINMILEKYQLEKLAYKKYSGYFTKMQNGKMMVFAYPGVFMRDQSQSTGQFCSYFDLCIRNDNDKQIFIIEECVNENIDFFLSEVK